MATDSIGGAKMAPEPEETAAALASSEADSDNPLSLVADPALSEDVALSLLKRPDLPIEALERLGKNSAALKHRKVKIALVEHPKTPRHVSLPIVRQLCTFDLVQVALTPTVPADLKRAADESLCNRLETISSGEKLTLAHRASGRVAGELLCDAEARVVRAALENTRLTEAFVVRAVMRPDAPAALIEAVCHHAQWSLRREVRVALLRNEKTPMARAVEFARSLPVAQLREILQSSRLLGNVKEYLARELERRKNRS